MTASLIAVIGGLIVLVFSADRFIAGAASLARTLGVPALIVGLTVIGFGTSAPELVVSIIASLQGRDGIAVGNVIGSNIANVTMVLGIAALLAPLTVHATLVRRELPVVIAVSLLVFLLALDRQLTALDGIILLTVLVSLLCWLAVLARRGESDSLTAEVQAGEAIEMRLPVAVAWVVFGLILLPASSQALVWGAVNIATVLGVSEMVIGLTLVAVGTSLPELATAVAALRKREHDLVLGNVAGSNLFNLLAVLPMPALLAPGYLRAGTITRDLPIMLATTVLMYLLCLGRDARLSRWKGALLLIIFTGYGSLLYQTRFQ